LAKLGAAAFCWLTFLNWIVKRISIGLLGRELLIYKSMKERIIKEKRVLTNFEEAVTNAAMVKNIDIVICGHTHFPADKVIEKERKTLRYLNCGDWVERCTATECINGNWSLHYFESPDEELIIDDELTIPDRKQIFHLQLEEMEIATLS
jgi:UDP-2,3-diacylglucosamine pyrophosphatase LpxH